MTIPTARDTVLELRGVEKSFAGPSGVRPVLSGVDLTVAPGEIVAVAGRSGSGKTTLLTLVAGMEQPDAGSITLFGAQARGDECTWSDMAILPQTLGMLDELTVIENVTLPLRLADVPGADDAVDLMSRLGVDQLADRFPSEVSLGEQQRAALARAAIVRPRLLLADEPISHQNQTWAEAMMVVLGGLAATGTTCLLATHNEIAFEAAHRVLELHAGRLRDQLREER